LLPRADDTTLFLVFELIDFFIFLFASWIMGRLEGRTVAEYGLPWRKMFGLQFWQGAFFGFASITGLLIAMRAFKVFYFGRFVLHGFDIWRWGVIYGRLLFILVAGGVPQSGLCAIHAFDGNRLLAGGSSLGSIFRLLASRQFWRRLDRIVQRRGIRVASLLPAASNWQSLDADRPAHGIRLG